MVRILTIDGPAGAGKSSVARRVAKMLGATYLDTGAMYRALALAAIRRGIAAADESGLAGLLRELDLHFEDGRLWLGGEDVSGEIRTPAVEAVVSRVSSWPAVREEMYRQQRRLAEGGRVVLDGRDAGTRIFPEADLKIFLTADPEVRALRRYRERAAQGYTLSLDEIRRDLRERDRQDREREVGPLVPAVDAHIIDTSALNEDQVVELVMGLATR